MTNTSLMCDNVNTYDRHTIHGYNCLERLALDLSWSWNHTSDKIWKQLDPKLWELTRNPWVVLQTVSKEKLEKNLSDPEFTALISNIEEINRKEEDSPAWFQKKFPNSPLSCVAYFSMEYMLCEALPIYSGGLGNVAGDQLKSASDLGVPVIAIGLLYQQGYFRQMIDSYGNQQALYPFNDPGQLPITPLRKANGEWLRLEITLPGYSIWLRAWQVKIGRRRLFLLDSNDAANFPAYRGLTNELYGGGLDVRIRQEMILGMGGWRLLEALNIQPEVCHLNEGHAAFVVLARAKSFMNATGLPFEEALAATRAGNLFTTHTAVSAGFDRFPSALVEQNLGAYAREQLKISVQDLLALGRLNPNDFSEPFNMAYLAARGSGAINAVSKLHSKVSRRLFQDLFPRWPEEEVPIGFVTNGVHMPSWDSSSSDGLWEEACGKRRWLGSTESLEKEIRAIPTPKLWKMRNDARKILIDFVRQRLALQRAASGESMEYVEHVKRLFDPSVLTLGFARRFATYKRPNLLLHDQERLLRILTNPTRPIQLIIAGKAHPADKPGQAMIQEWYRFIQRPEAREHVMFLSDYDVMLTEQLVQGVDVWVNTPRRPWEACGTSGMKVLVNGGLNLSELDGWWAEAYNPQVGWAIGDGKEHDADPAWDAAEADALYSLLENSIAPEYYKRDKEGIPVDWVNRIRESMAQLTPQYSANRAVREYTERHYIPAAANIKQRLADKGVVGTRVVNWRHALNEKWKTIRFSDVKVETNNGQHNFEAQVYLDDLGPNLVKVELYGDKLNGSGPGTKEMTLVRQLSGSANTYVYQVKIPAVQPASLYTPRIVPQLDGANIPLEANQILWQR